MKGQQMIKRIVVAIVLALSGLAVVGPAPAYAADDCDGSYRDKHTAWNQTFTWSEFYPESGWVKRSVRLSMSMIYAYCPGNGPLNTQPKVKVKVQDHCWTWLTGFNERYSRRFQGTGANPVYSDTAGTTVDPTTLWNWNPYPEGAYKEGKCVNKWIAAEDRRWMQLRYDPHWRVHSSIRFRDGQDSIESDWEYNGLHVKFIKPDEDPWAPGSTWKN